ncbi:MAG: GAF domain-containing protein [Planctomycetota bacterium]
MTAHQAEQNTLHAIQALPASTTPKELLDIVITHFACPVGTIHRMDDTTGLLHLVEKRGIPDAILSAIERIPLGKGMAGLAAERRAPVTVCNLQTDQSGQAKPAAKLTGMEGSIAVPMLVDGSLRGVLGIAMPTAHQFTESETTLLLQLATEIGKRMID